MILGCHDSIRSGEWWFLRQPRVPLDQQQACQNRISRPAQKRRRRIRGGKPFEELLIYERQDSSDPLQNCPRATGISMADFTSKAARLCFRLRILRLLNTGDFLQRAPLPVPETLPADQKSAAPRFDFPSAREWQLRLRSDVKRWTPDLLCTVSVHNGQPHPTPGIRGWGAWVTWLVLKHGVCVGKILLNSFLYAVCAAVPAGARVSGEQQRQESYSHRLTNCVEVILACCRQIGWVSYECWCVMGETSLLFVQRLVQLRWIICLAVWGAPNHEW